MSGPNIFFINLDRAKDRAAYMWACLERAGLADTTERVPAWDSRTDSIRNGFKRGPSSLCYALDPTEIACWESHRKVWQHMLDCDLEHAVIFEDDVVFSPNFKGVLDEVCANAKDFDLIKLDGIPSRQRLGPAQPCGALTLKSINNVSYSSAAYLLSRQGAKRLLDESESYNMGLDMEMFTPRKGWRMWQLFPAICVQGMFLCNADRAGLPRSIVGGQRKQDSGHRERFEMEPWWFKIKRLVQVRLTDRYPNALWRRRKFLRSGGTIEPIALKDDFVRYK